MLIRFSFFIDVRVHCLRVHRGVRCHVGSGLSRFAVEPGRFKQDSTLLLAGFIYREGV